MGSQAQNNLKYFSPYLLKIILKGWLKDQCNVYTIKIISSCFECQDEKVVSKSRLNGLQLAIEKSKHSVIDTNGSLIISRIKEQHLI